MKISLHIVWLCALSALLIGSCSRKKNPTEPSGGNTIPAGIARVSGTLRDAAGAAVPNAFLHVVYDLPAMDQEKAARPLSPPTACLQYYTAPESPRPALTTQCGGTTPIPDGAIVYLFWDRDSDGPDETDPRLPVCDNPPDCEGGPLETFNYNELPLNGTAMELGAGYFDAANCLSSYGRNISPPLVYGRIYCGDGRVLWQSDVVTLQSGPQEYRMAFQCTPCTGDPVIPDWHLTQAYPNPVTDTVRVEVGLQRPASVLLALRWPNSNRIDTLLSGAQSSGVRTLTAVLNADRPNGLYDVQLDVPGLYSARHTLLKNVSAEAALRATKEAAVSDADGHFTMDIPAGITIDRRGSSGANQGAALLDRVRLVALKSGFALSDSTFAVESSSAYEIQLTLRPQ